MQLYINGLQWRSYVNQLVEGGGGGARANLEVKVENQSTIAQVYGLVLSIQFVETCQANK
jgi:hypothetical protein